MKTADLIIALSAQDAAQPKRALSWRILAGAVLGVVLAAAIVVWIFGVRGDLEGAMGATMMKSAYGLIAALSIAPAALMLCRPNAGLRSLWLIVLAFVGASLAAACFHLMSAQSLAPLGLSAGLPECFKRVPLLAVPIGAVLLVIARSFAPTRLTLAGGAIGALSGAIGIIPYAMFCPMDSVAYVTTWYLASIGVCAGLGALVGARVLRWI